ncbi:NAD(P)/FAD-dependent oxidoreductase [Paramaledivibacter caminithermalis]|jgi:NADPH-dependent 2,4-dienoyl-CoA reductase/sulfur reductase-like enzyme|uniref:Thioredoxin reductase n=1 Tax=Paramaledivibacter caminithermalis (strain DSM 15212 / CIP 107654 / DViRD3) TaxID=1121301 RepID=A0A1M6Q8P2_PARC5|nr:Thioredoxin reductase [Paramaledivibacter caminithermalis DSM 15212]
MQSYDIVVIGGGPAGLAAAIEAKKNGIDSILLVERDRELGGILQQCIHNGFGLHIFKEELTGPEYAEKFIVELRKLGIEYRLDTMVLEIRQDKVVTAINSEDGFMMLKAGAIILAMGCRERTRGAINIPGTRPAGVFTAGTAQRFVNMEGYIVGKKVVILGSGDIGLIMARRMTLEGAKVLAVAELMPFSGGLTRNIVQCLDDYNIPLLLSHTVTEIKGKDRVEGVVIAEVDENRNPIYGTEKFFECDTLLLSVGLIPENELTQNAGIEMDPITLGPVVNEAMETSVEGIFACGNVVQVHDLVDFVTEESRKAGRSAAKYIKKELKTKGLMVNTKPGKGIRYIVPQRIRLENLDKTLDLFMRVDNVYKDMDMVVSIDGKEINRVKKRHVAPGEIETVKIKREDIIALDYSVITVSFEKEGA